MNKTASFKKLQWQLGFGVVSFGKRQLSWVRAYIQNQKEHHASGRIQDRPERVSMDDDGAPLDG